VISGIIFPFFEKSNPIRTTKITTKGLKIVKYYGNI